MKKALLLLMVLFALTGFAFAQDEEGQDDGGALTLAGLEERVAALEENQGASFNLEGSVGFWWVVNMNDTENIRHGFHNVNDLHMTLIWKDYESMSSEPGNDCVEDPKVYAEIVIDEIFLGIDSNRGESPETILGFDTDGDGEADEFVNTCDPDNSATFPWTWDGLMISLDYAKLHIYDAYIEVFGPGDPASETDYEHVYISPSPMGIWGPNGGSSWLANEMIDSNEDDSVGGLAVGYENDMISTSLAISTEACPEEQNTATSNKYWLDYDFEITLIEALTINTGFNIGLGYENFAPVGFGAGVSYDLEINDSLSLIPAVGFDGVFTVDDRTPGNGSAFEFAIGVGVTLSTGEKESLSLGTSMDCGGMGEMWPEGDEDCIPGLTVGMSLYKPHENIVGVGADDMQMSMAVSFFEGRDEGQGILPGFAAAVSFEIADVLADDKILGFFMYAEYAIPVTDCMNIVPSIGTVYYSKRTNTDLWDNGEVGDDNWNEAGRLGAFGGALYAHLGVSVEEIAPHCDLHLIWDSKNLFRTDPELGSIGLGMMVNF